jgi:hypothetical protein
MKNGIIIILAIGFLCCSNKKSTNSESNEENVSIKEDTVYYYYWEETNNIVYEFDTAINQVLYYMKFYCLNDSAIINETWGEERNKNSKLVQYVFDHNYAIDFKIKNQQETYELKLLKESFRDSLSADFLKICQMWKNRFSHIENGQPLFKATLAQPGTDYQYAVFYTITENGKLKIIRVEDESCC